MQEWNLNRVLLNTNLEDILQGKGVYPQMIELWLTSRCNLNCVFCNALHNRKHHDTDFDVNKLDKIIELAKYGVKAITIEGGGEPTLHPRFEYIVEELCNHFFVGLITNGTKKLPEKIINKLSFIRISLDASDKDSFIQLKNKDYFDYIIENLYYIKSKKLSNTVVGVSYILTENSIKNISQLLNKFEHNNLVDYVQFKPLEETNKYPSCCGSYDIENECKLYKNFYCYFVNCKESNDNKPCYVNQLSSTIMPDGDVMFCKRLKINKEPLIIGNIYNDSIHHIYKGDKKMSMVDFYLKKENCIKNCPTCRLTKYNNHLINNLSYISQSTKYFL